MEAVLVLLIVIGVVIWLCARTPGGRQGPAPGPGSGRVAPQPATEPSAPDVAFFDGYIWGRLQQRHDERQHDHGSGRGSGHDHDMFDGDDGYDDDS
jgi:hypothetical protein